MFIQILVERTRGNGKTHRGGPAKKTTFPLWEPSGTAWESGFWRLVIGSKLVDKIGGLEGYRRLHRILEQLGAITPFSGSISLFGAYDFRHEKESALGPGQFDATPSWGAGSTPFQEAYVYSLKSARPL